MVNFYLKVIDLWSVKIYNNPMKEIIIMVALILVTLVAVIVRCVSYMNFKFDIQSMSERSIRLYSRRLLKEKVKANKAEAPRLPNGKVDPRYVQKESYRYAVKPGDFYHLEFRILMGIFFVLATAIFIGTWIVFFVATFAPSAVIDGGYWARFARIATKPVFLVLISCLFLLSLTFASCSFSSAYVYAKNRDFYVEYLNRAELRRDMGEFIAPIR